MTVTFAVPEAFVEPEQGTRRKYVPCEVATETRDAALEVIRDAIRNDPRTLQKEIGPSEVGNPCDFCLGAKLAGFEKVDEDDAWLPFIGTAVHSKLEGIFGQSKFYGEWVTEARVSVGRILETVVDGNSDLFHLTNGCVVDWKLMWWASLKEFRLGGPKPMYRSQLHLYGKGYADKGYKVEYVAIFGLPASSRSLDDAIWWAEPYDEEVAIAALQRAEHIAQQIDLFGWDEVRQILPKLDGCYDCPRFEAAMEGEG